MLLSSLNKVAEEREAEVLNEDEIEPETKVVTKEVVSEKGPIKMEDSEEQYKLTSAIDELVADDKEEVDLEATLEGLVDETKKEEPVPTKVAADEARKKAIAQAKAEAKKAEEAKLKMVQAEKEKQAAQKEAEEKLRQAEKVREEERLEVIAYEKQRAEKLAKKAEAKAKAAVEQAKKEEKEPTEKIVDIDLEAEKKVVKEAADTGYANAVKEMDSPEEIMTSKSVEVKPPVEKEQAEDPVTKVGSLEGDIDIAAEQRAVKEAADAAYLEAVREMDQEED